MKTTRSSTHEHKEQRDFEFLATQADLKYLKEINFESEI
jgi:hypothetical protein